MKLFVFPECSQLAKEGCIQLLEFALDLYWNCEGIVANK